jgi:hypothetical protein
MSTTIGNQRITAMSDGFDAPATASPTVVRRRGVTSWLVQDSPYIIMLLLALVGMVGRLPVNYWVILMPVFCIICIVAGWRQFETREGRLQLIVSMVLSWAALILAIFLMYDRSFTGVLGTNATTLALTTLLALGTFVAGVNTRVWRISAVGLLLFIAIPAMGWVDQNGLLLVAATLAVIAVGGVTWWLGQWHANRRAAREL